jgi:hypothetical protein
MVRFMCFDLLKLVTSLNVVISESIFQMGENFSAVEEHSAPSTQSPGNSNTPTSSAPVVSNGYRAVPLSPRITKDSERVEPSLLEFVFDESIESAGRKIPTINGLFIVTNPFEPQQSIVIFSEEEPPVCTKVSSTVIKLVYEGETYYIDLDNSVTREITRNNKTSQYKYTPIFKHEPVSTSGMNIASIYRQFVLENKGVQILHKFGNKHGIIVIAKNHTEKVNLYWCPPNNSKLAKVKSANSQVNKDAISIHSTKDSIFVKINKGERVTCEINNESAQDLLPDFPITYLHAKV